MDLNIIIPIVEGYKTDNLKEVLKAANAQNPMGVNVKVLQPEGTSIPAAFNKTFPSLTKGYVLFLLPWVMLKEGVFDNIASLAETDDKPDMMVYSYVRSSFNIRDSVMVNAGAENVSGYLTALHDHPGDVGYTGLWNKLLSAEIISRLGITFNENQKELFEYSFLLEYLQGCKRIISIKEEIGIFCTQPVTKRPSAERISEKLRTLKQYEHLACKELDSDTAAAILGDEYRKYYIYEKLRLSEAGGQDKRESVKLLRSIKKRIPGSRAVNEIALFTGVLRGRLAVIKRYFTEDRKNAAKLQSDKRQKSWDAFWQKNYRHLRKPMRSIHGALGRQKRILLYCESSTMKPHIFDYYNCIESMSGVRIYIYYPGNWDNEVPRNVKLVRSRFAALNTPWDLLVCADAVVPLYYDKDEAAILYINHGLHMISYDEGRSLYAYEQGRDKFTMMFEPNKEYADILSQEYPAETICHTGYKNAENLRSKLENKKKYRNELGVPDDKILVAVFGTWGMDSLFHRVGRSLIEQAKELMKENYMFILSIHPKEYSKYDEAVKPYGKYIESLSEQGFIIRNPRQSSIGYMIASDVVICDYSTLCEEAMLAGKPVILSDFPKTRVWKKSIICDYMDKGYIYSEGSNLKEMIDKCLQDEDCRQYAEDKVKNLLPPESGYAHTVYTATERLLKDYK